MTESALSGVTSFVWDGRQVASYEAALEAGHAAVGAYSARIAEEKRKAEPDGQKIEAWRSARLALIADRDGVDASDPVAVAAARARFTQAARRVREG